MPPTAEPTAGRPQAMPSTSTRPKGSGNTLGRATTSAAWYSGTTSDRLPTQRQVSAGARSRSEAT
jgi:hypothetical protein